MRIQKIRTSTSTLSSEIHTDGMCAHELFELSVQHSVEFVFGRHAGEEARLRDR